MTTEAEPQTAPPAEPGTNVSANALIPFSGGVMGADGPSPVPGYSMQQLWILARIFAQSGLYKDTQQAAQAFTKIMLGAALGLDPASAMSGLYIIDGRPCLSANVIAARIKRHPAYDYDVLEHDETQCVLQFYRVSKMDGKRQPLGIVSFDMKDAQTAGLLDSNRSKYNWVKYPRNMLFARAISNGARWHTPEVFGGVSIYTPEEIGATVTWEEDGSERVIDVPSTVGEYDGAMVNGDTSADEDGVEFIADEDGNLWTPPACRFHGPWEQSRTKSGQIRLWCAAQVASGRCGSRARRLSKVEQESLELDAALRDIAAGEVARVRDPDWTEPEPGPAMSTPAEPPAWWGDWIKRYTTAREVVPESYFRDLLDGDLVPETIITFAETDDGTGLQPLERLDALLTAAADAHDAEGRPADAEARPE